MITCIFRAKTFRAETFRANTFRAKTKAILDDDPLSTKPATGE
jgi:hypothetical protein